MENIIIIAIVLFIVGLAAWYVIRAKKHGRKCIGCPNGGQCSGNCSNCQPQASDE
ncbi:MAG: FeoB-associated Cys-rich membrane protein [Clostridiales bacterium]|nr:FeoB-associated Cys-rich membrane protein [Clostridiales bacterium]